MSAGILKRGHRACCWFSLLLLLGCLAALAGYGTTNRGGLTPGSTVGSVNSVDLQNRPVDPFQAPAAKAVVLIFVRTDCPISNRYAPEIRRLYEKYVAQGFVFWLVYPDPDSSPDTITRHLKEYRLPPVALRDPHQSLVRKAGVQVTPEVAVFLPDGREIYRGRIDNRVEDFGKERPEPTQHDLDETLVSVLAGKTQTNRTTRAVGCYISDLR